MALGEMASQPRAVRMLERMIAGGRLPHALLFIGPAGAGKVSCARALASALDCLERPGSGCGRCASCAKIEAGVHPDVLLHRPAGAGNILSIDIVRDLAAKLAFAPHEGRARVVILDDADRFTVEAANAFLKTLEEPPAGTYFVLCTTSPERLPVTIRSRCQPIRFLGATFSGGRDNEGEARDRRRALAGAIVAAARGADFQSATTAASELAQSKEDVGPALDLVALFYRDAAALAAGLPAERLANAEDLPALEAEARRAGSPAPLARRAGAVLDAQFALLGYANAQLTIENLIWTLRA